LEVQECKGLYVVDATSIAEELKLRTTSFSMVNTAMVGAFAKASGLLDLESIERVVGEMAPVKKESNVAAARKAFEKVKEVSR
jgi:Pyruvate/2-oxoacid:ferredoxin oxidoreductase gamma subunit